MRKEDIEIAPDQLYQLAERQQFKCALSGRPLDPETAELDHRVAKSDGGTDALNNLQWVEGTVNRAKGSMGTSAFIEMCRAVARMHAEKTQGKHHLDVAMSVRIHGDIDETTDDDGYEHAENKGEKPAGRDEQA